MGCFSDHRSWFSGESVAVKSYLSDGTGIIGQHMIFKPVVYPL